MKRRTNKDIILFLILIPLFLAGAFYIQSRMDNKLPSYTVDNKGRLGYSIFFETLKELNYPVEKSLSEVGAHDADSIQIVAALSGFDVNSEKVKNWVEDGGTLVYLTPRNIQFIGYEGIPEVKGNLRIYSFGEGNIIASDIDYLANKTLVKKKDNAYALYKEIAALNKKIYFNEAHIFVRTVEASLWDYVPIELKFIIYQILLVLTAFFYYKGKPFGKPVPLYEEVEREENEYLYSSAALYKQADSWDLMFDIYYRSLLKELNCQEEEFLDIWKREDLPHFNKAQKVYEFAKLKNKKKPREYMKIVNILEGLSKVLKNRRDVKWNTLKRI